MTGSVSAVFGAWNVTVSSINPWFITPFEDHKGHFERENIKLYFLDKKIFFFFI